VKGYALHVFIHALVASDAFHSKCSAPLKALLWWWRRSLNAQLRASKFEALRANRDR